MCVLVMLKNEENNETEEIGLVTPTPDHMQNSWGVILIEYV